MDIKKVIELYKLWDDVYPFLAKWIYELADGSFRTLLELGPFSLGITIEILKRYNDISASIALDSPDLISWMKQEIQKNPYNPQISFINTPLSPLKIPSNSFDLIIFRGAFFFLKPDILAEIHRVLAKGGIAIIGGGFGKTTPQEVIDTIALESKRLNKLLGKVVINVDELKKMADLSNILPKSEIITEGGLWLKVTKR
ncbi:MAG: class I SAM-dependent methyltransferase [Deltaproteobacteria bacterium]|nr:class I SAM-dependent methyltransferase [Deltaproteobacteria bacterium]